MLHQGHAGFTLLILSPIFFVLNLRDFNAVATLAFATGLSWLPDIDLDLEVKHRTVTHNITFAFVVGAVFAVIFNYAGIWFVGFVGAFLGTVCHLLGDLTTHMEFKPLAPFRNDEVALQKADSCS